MSCCKQKIFIIKGQAADAGDNDRNLKALKLPHPCTGRAAGFLTDTTFKDILEIQTFNDSPRSWLIGSAVEPDGEILVCTPFDPLFIIISYMRKSRYFQRLEDVLTDCEFPDACRLAGAVRPARLALVADVKGDDDLQTFRYSEERTLAWLERKARRLAAVLESKGLHGTSGKADNFVKVAPDQLDKEAYLKFAWGIASEYLAGDLSAALRQRLQLPEDKVTRPAADAEPPAKRARSEPVTPLEDYGALPDQNRKALAPQNAKQKALAKSAAGSKSITSFFKKK